jgi:hypothetical protein
VLIDSTRPRRETLPVLTQGPDDRGPVAVADTLPAFPRVDGIAAPPPDRTAPPLKQLELRGHHLAGDAVTVTARAPDVLERPGEPRGDAAIGVTVPLDDEAWPPGLYAVAAEIDQGDEPRTTPAVPFALTPEITDAPPIPVTRDAAGNALITLHCRPAVWPEQAVSLVIGSQEVEARPRLAKTAQLDFVIPGIAGGDHYIRLRVDYTDSALVVRPQDGPPRFNPDVRVTVP